MFDFEKEYVFLRRQLTQKTVVEETLFPVAQGKVVEENNGGVRLSNGLVLNAHDYDFASPVSDRDKEEKNAAVKKT